MKYVFKEKLKPIGMRNIKTGVSIIICVLISQIFKLEYPFYACIAAVITLSGSVFGTFKAARHRMLGTTVGAIVGLLCVIIEPRSAILSGLGIVVIIYICNVLEWDDSIGIAGIVFLAIMVNLKGTTPISYSVNRLIDTFIGISVAALVNYLIFPPKLSDKVEANSNVILARLSETLGKIINSDENANTESFSIDIMKLEREFKLLKNEGRIRKSERVNIDELDKLVFTLKNLYIHLCALQTIKTRSDLSIENAEKYFKIYNENHLGKDKVSVQKEIEVIYNYHIGKAFDIIIDLK